jgi:hypothetical protein
MVAVVVSLEVRRLEKVIIRVRLWLCAWRAKLYLTSLPLPRDVVRLLTCIGSRPNLQVVVKSRIGIVLKVFHCCDKLHKKTMQNAYYSSPLLASTTKLILEQVHSFD